MKKFWRFKSSATPGTIELLLYGEIQSERSWCDLDGDGGGIYAGEFIADLQALGNVNQITCRVNSPGGDIFAAVAIYTQLKMHAAKVICIIDGLAASAATFILMAADEIQIPTGAMIMIHDPLVVLMGMYKADELAKQADALAIIKDSIVAIYAERTGTSKAKLIEMMSNETWMSADEAIKNGFADKKISDQVEASMKGSALFVNKVEHDLSKFKKLPSVHALNQAKEREVFGAKIAEHVNVKLGHKVSGEPAKSDYYNSQPKNIRDAIDYLAQSVNKNLARRR